MLTFSYGLGDERELTIRRNIEGTELGWCLGAALVMVEEKGG
jgi:guanosine-diphosphatase